MNAKTKARIQSGGYRAIRTFLQAFLASLTVSALCLYSAAAWKSAAAAGVAAVFALVQRWLDTVDAIPTIPPG